MNNNIIPYLTVLSSLFDLDSENEFLDCLICFERQNNM